MFFVLAALVREDCGESFFRIGPDAKVGVRLGEKELPVS